MIYSQEAPGKQTRLQTHIQLDREEISLKIEGIDIRIPFGVTVACTNRDPALPVIIEADTVGRSVITSRILVKIVVPETRRQGRSHPLRPAMLPTDVEILGFNKTTRTVRFWASWEALIYTVE